ncbi:unnamed protein product [Psylliodes chrysocephalus]|uniref:Uncharacterized protein n=1 Tax=Psylliodes chrysocephalus TaxID=3402493 RepID=A0A9P0G7R7_9CUCU|nr:unnamed protein product [Psylliodes chrysocephala]
MGIPDNLTVPTCHSNSSSSSSSSSFYGSSVSSSEDCDDLINDTAYLPKNNEESDSEKENVADNTQKNTAGAGSHTDNSTPHLNNPSTSAQNIQISVSPAKKGLKRKNNKEMWKRNILKKSRNSGKAYETHTKNEGFEIEWK